MRFLLTHQGAGAQMNDACSLCCEKVTFPSEGSELDLDATDRGNWYNGVLIGSKLGVTGDDLAAYLGRAPSRADMAAVTEAIAMWAFQRRYWNVLRCPEMNPGIAILAADHAYNAGDVASAKILQTLVGVTADGLVGDAALAAIARVCAAPVTTTPFGNPETVKALQAALSITVDGIWGLESGNALAEAAPKSGALALCARLANAQAAHYRSMAQFPEYGQGWLARVWLRCNVAMSIA